jgi:hypothetical protein
MQLRIERRMVLKIPWGLVGVTLAIASSASGTWPRRPGRRTPRSGRGSS